MIKQSTKKLILKVATKALLLTILVYSSTLGAFLTVEAIKERKKAATTEKECLAMVERITSVTSSGLKSRRELVEKRASELCPNLTTSQMLALIYLNNNLQFDEVKQEIGDGVRSLSSAIEEVYDQAGPPRVSPSTPPPYSGLFDDINLSE